MTPRATQRSDAGFSIVLAVFSIMILITLGLAMVALVVEDSDLSVSHVRENQAFYAAQAGVEYAIVKLSGNWSWGGLAAPGKNVGAGSFWVSPPDAVDETGAALPAGCKRIVATGVVGNATRQIQVQVASGSISTYAGTGNPGYTGNGGQATAADLWHGEGVAVASNGDLYVADTDNHVIRKVTAATGIITTVAGNGSPGSTGDGGAATSARLKSPEDVIVTSNGDLYIADTGSHEIRKVTFATGVITTVAGNGTPGSSGDGGAATAARLNSPRGIALASNGDIYIGDRSNNKIRKVIALTGTIVTYAGTGTAGYAGDGGAAVLAKLNRPQGIHLASTGDLYIADALNNAIRKVTAAGIITTFAGTGAAGFSGDGGAATSAQLSAPEAAHLSASGELYIADTGNHRIRMVTTGGVISTVVGTGTAGSSGDGGSPTSAQLDTPRGLAIHSSGVYYIGDRNNNKIRRVGGNFAVVAWVETRS